jgi:hypothetical protein
MINVGNQVSKQLWDQVRGQVIRTKLLNKLESQLDSKISRRLRDGIVEQIRSKVWNPIIVKLYIDVKQM